MLRNLGCDKVVYLTRQGDESSFARGVAGLLGMSADEDAALYDLDEDSAFELSLQQTDATWCTDWNNQPAFPTRTIVGHAYDAPLYSHDAYFDGGYANLSRTGGARGCTP